MKEIIDEYRDRDIAQCNANLDACRDLYDYIMSNATQDDIRTRARSIWAEVAKAAITRYERPLPSNCVLALARAALKAERNDLDILLDTQAKRDAVERKREKAQAERDAAQAERDAKLKGTLDRIEVAANENRNALNIVLHTLRTITSKVFNAFKGIGVRISHLNETVGESIKATERVGQTCNNILGEVVNNDSGANTHTAPDPRTYKVSTKELSDMLERKNCKRTPRQIEMWEQHLLTDGKKGTRPPQGYTLYTRLTVETASAWVISFARDEGGKHIVTRYNENLHNPALRENARPITNSKVSKEDLFRDLTQK